MSRMPVADWLRLADQRRPVEAFADKVAAISQSQNMPKPVAALVTMHQESVALINYLAILVDRGGNSILIDEAGIAIQRWNRTVREAGALVQKEDFQPATKNS
jgi:hypothetical protein